MALAPLEEAIQIAGGQSALAKAMGGSTKQQHIHNWLIRGSVPAEQRPAIERAVSGQVPVERFGSDVAWRRVKDRTWPWNGGRPLQDHTAVAAA